MADDIFADLVPKNQAADPFADLVDDPFADLVGGGASDQPGAISNSLRNVGERAADLLGNTVKGVGNALLSDALMQGMPVRAATELSGGKNPINEAMERTEKTMTEATGVNPGIYRDDKGEWHFSANLDADQNTARGAVKAVGDEITDTNLGYKEKYSFQNLLNSEGLMEGLGNFLGMAGEKVPAMIPDMLATLNPATLGAYIVGRTEELAEVRADNDGRGENVADKDRLVALPTAIAVSLWERFAAKGTLGIGGVTTAGQAVKATGSAMGKESLQEAGEEGLEYATESVGTQTGWDPKTALMRSAEGATLGGVAGGAIRGTTSAWEVRQEKLAQRRADARGNFTPVTAEPTQQVAGLLEQSRPPIEVTPSGTAILDPLQRQQAQVADLQKQLAENRPDPEVAPTVEPKPALGLPHLPTNPIEVTPGGNAIVNTDKVRNSKVDNNRRNAALAKDVQDAIARNRPEPVLDPVQEAKKAEVFPKKKERRKDFKTRKSLDEMTMDELRKEAEYQRIRADTDPLTGIRSRALYEDLSKDPKTPPYRVYIDLDGLKAVNDTYSHDAGDALLIAAAKSVTAATKKPVHRVGGDEFALIADTEAEAIALAQKIRAAAPAAKFDIKLPSGKTQTITGIGMSLGAGKTALEAEALMKQEKVMREQQGLRSRGEMPQSYRDQLGIQIAKDLQKVSGEEFQSAAERLGYGGMFAQKLAANVNETWDAKKKLAALDELPVLREIVQEALKARAEAIVKGQAAATKPVETKDDVKAAKKAKRDKKLEPLFIAKRNLDERFARLEGIDTPAANAQRAQLKEELRKLTQKFLMEVSEPLTLNDEAASVTPIKPPPSGPKNQQGFINPTAFLPQFVIKGLDSTGKNFRTLLARIKSNRDEKFLRNALGDEEFHWDKFTDKMGYMLGLTQIADMNKHIPGLSTTYLGAVRAMSNFKNNLLKNPDQRIQDWMRLNPTESESLSAIMFEETVNGQRLPLTDPRLQALSPQAQRLKLEIEKDFLDFLNTTEAEMIADATRNMTGAPRAALIAEIQKDFANLKQKPYFPLTRFGKHTVKVMDAQGTVQFFGTYEDENMQHQKYAELKATAGPGMRVSKGQLSEVTASFAGMPQVLLKSMLQKVNLTAQQTQEVKDLMYLMSPSQSFRKHLAHRKGTAGYSEDAIRAYAHYFLHGANHLARLKYRDDMADGIAQMERSSRVLEQNGFNPAKRVAITDWVKRHRDYIMNPQNEWAHIRAAGFMWYMGFVPKAALVNLTQTPMITYPHLAAQYGDAAAVQALGKAYKEVSMGIAGRRLSPSIVAMLDKAESEGHTNQSFASTLAGIADGNMLERNLATSPIGRTSKAFLRGGTYLFTVTEQYNRRVTMHATYELELARRGGPDGSIVNGSYVMGQNEEAAYNNAIKTLDKTQYEYSAWNRPPFMRGKIKSTVWLFQQYLQNTLYFLWRDPGNVRALGLIALIGGAQGLPGIEDLLDVIDKFVSLRSNNRFDSRKELREVWQHLHLNPHLMMHGLSSYGFVPAGPLAPLSPVMGDMSGSVSLGRIVPGLGPALSQSPSSTEIVKDVGGAMASIFVNAIKFMGDNNPVTLREIEKAFMPTEVKNITRAGRYLENEAERLPNGADIPLENPGFSAVQAALGGRSPKVAQTQEIFYETKEAQRFYQDRRSYLMKTYWQAVLEKDKKQIGEAKDAIRRFNKEVPYASQKIMGKDVSQSVRGHVEEKKLTERGIVGGRDGYEISKDYRESFE